MKVLSTSVQPLHPGQKLQAKKPDAKQKAEEFCESEMNKATGGMPLPFDMKSFL